MIATVYYNALVINNNKKCTHVYFIIIGKIFFSIRDYSAGLACAATKSLRAQQKLFAFFYRALRVVELPSFHFTDDGGNARPGFKFNLALTFCHPLWAFRSKYSLCFGLR